jgi:hypothetical protein
MRISYYRRRFQGGFTLMLDHLGRRFACPRLVCSHAVGVEEDAVRAGVTITKVLKT